MTMDRISELPSEIIHHILSFVPLKYAILTSILSKRWRYQWTFNPHLIFSHNLNIMDIRECLKQYKAKQLCRLEITLKLPSDSSKELKYECIFYMKQWIKFAVKRQVQRLIIYADIGKGIVFRAPECLFHSQSIQILGLSRCIFDPPSDFKGFPCLKTLILHRVKMEGVESIESIVSTSPYLRAMKLSDVPNLQHLNIPSSSSLRRLDVLIEDAIEICGPNLQVLSCVGTHVSDFHLKNLSSLIHSNISSIVCCQGGRNPEQLISEWGSSLANLSQVKVLEVNTQFIQIMYAKNYLQRSCGVEFKRLKRFHFESYIDTNFTLSAMISFLQDCPSLETLRIDVRFSLIYKEEVGFPNIWNQNMYNWISKYMGREHAQVQGRLHLGDDRLLSKLENVTLSGFSGTIQEMKLLEFLLQKAITLKNIVLQSMIGFGTRKYDFLSTKLSSLPRSSLTAKIEFRDELQKQVYTKYC